jgi:hypothetical protein
MRLPALTMYGAMLAATPLVGGHYFIDIVGGAVIAAAAIATVRIAVARLAATDAVRGSVTAVPAASGRA